MFVVVLWFACGVSTTILFLCVFLYDKCSYVWLYYILAIFFEHSHKAGGLASLKTMFNPTFSLKLSCIKSEIWQLLWNSSFLCMLAFVFVALHCSFFFVLWYFTFDVHWNIIFYILLYYTFDVHRYFTFHIHWNVTFYIDCCRRFKSKISV